jgi:hypothetical protein
MFMKKDLSPSDFTLYTAPSGKVKLKVIIQDETLWLTQKMMAELFDVDRTVITKHLRNIFDTGELEEKSNVQKMHFTHSDKPIRFYNLDAIISVGYRVNSSRATQFRIWATQTLKGYIVKGFVMNDERLKQGGQVFGKDYFQELLERVHSIRASERRIYLQITDIFAECSTDYDKNSKMKMDFFAMVQNKFHFAIMGQTAAEIIHSHADRKKDHMGLTTWKNSPDGRVISSDVKVAKNYLEEKEIKKLERTVSGFFDYIENLIENRQSFTMAEFAESVDKFLNFNEYRVLEGKGRISRKQAEKKALEEYGSFNKTQKIDSDFEKEVKKMLEK